MSAVREVEPLPLELVTEPDGTRVVRLTRDNGPAVWDWADSKPFFSPTPDGSGLEITGLTVFTPSGRVKAEFGDSVTLDAQGQFGVRRGGGES